jgi:hypothetical protein
MNTPFPAPPPAYPRWPWWIACTWISLVSAGVVVDYLLASRVASHIQSVPRSTQVKAMERRQDDLEQRLTALAHPADPVRRSDIQAVRQATDAHLAQLEQALDSRASAADLAALQTRLDQLDHQLAAEKAKPAAMRVRHPRAVVPPAPPVPPFVLLGTERRGEEIFLAVAPGASAPIDQTTLLRPGEATAGWQLEALDADTATFRANGQTVRLDLPGRTP